MTARPTAKKVRGRDILGPKQRGVEKVSKDELKNKYGRNKKARQLYNAAIRTETPGGAKLLDLLELVSKMKQRQWVPDVAKMLTVIEDRIQGIRDEMVDEIKIIYEVEKK